MSIIYTIAVFHVHLNSTAHCIFLFIFLHINIPEHMKVIKKRIINNAKKHHKHTIKTIQMHVNAHAERHNEHRNCGVNKL